MTTIRRARPEDIPAIAQVHDASLRAQGEGHYSEVELTAMAPQNRDVEKVDETILNREERYVAVADSGNEIIGVGGVHLSDGRLLGIFVSPNHMGRGIGSDLLAHIEAHARDHGQTTLTIFSALNAVGFYKANGFKKVGKTSEGGTGGPLGPYDSDGVDINAVELRKEL